MRVIAADFTIRLTLAMGVSSLACLMLFVALRHVDGVRGITGGSGTLLALNGSAVGIWSAIRLRRFGCVASAIPALITLTGWVWIVPASLQL